MSSDTHFHGLEIVAASVLGLCREKQHDSFCTVLTRKSPWESPFFGHYPLGNSPSLERKKKKVQQNTHLNNPCSDASPESEPRAPSPI